MAMNRNNAAKQNSNGKYGHLGQEDEEELETYTSAADMEGSTNSSSH